MERPGEVLHRGIIYKNLNEWLVCTVLCPQTHIQYLYFQNLKATANPWLWELKDFCILGIAVLLSVTILIQTGIVIPVAVTLCCGFLTIRMDDTTVLDFIKYAVRYFISTQQHYEWR